MEIAVSVDSLLRLPQGAAYHRKSGQANINVTTRGDTVYITGTCDSLQRQVEYYEALYHTARDALNDYHENVSNERERRANPANIALAFSGIIPITIIIAKRNGKK